MKYRSEGMTALADFILLNVLYKAGAFDFVMHKETAVCDRVFMQRFSYWRVMQYNIDWNIVDGRTRIYNRGVRVVH